MKMSKGLRILIGVVAGVIILIILASVMVKIIFTKEKLLSLLVPRIEEALKREVEIEDVTVSIFGGLGADVKGMRVLNPSGFVQKELFKFDQLSIRVKFLPLLRKRVEIKKLILESPEINLEKNKEGGTNFEDLTKSEGGAIVIPVAFDQLQIKNGKILYIDNKDPKKIVLHQLEQTAKLSLDEKMENAKITGKITVDQIELNLPGYKGTLPPLKFSLEHDINLNMPEDFLDIKSLKIGIAKVSLDVKGSVEKVSTTPILNLTVESDKIQLEDIFASLPKEESSPLNQITTSGNLTISASFQGGTKAKLLPQIQGKITFQKVKVDFVDVPQPFNMPYGEINFDSRSLSFFSSEAKLGEVPMELKLVIEDFSDPNLTSELKTKMNLALVSEFVSLPEKTNLSGQADINVKAYGKIKKIEKMNLSGRVDLQKAEVATPALGVPIRNLNAGILLKGGDIDISDLSLSLGKSSLNLQGKVYGAVPYFLSPGREKPLFSFSLDSRFLDLDEVFPISEKVNAEEETPGADSILLPDINVGGQVSIQRAIFREMEFNNLSASLDVTDGVLRLDNIIAEVFSGSVGGEVSCNLNDIEHIQYDMNLTANQIEANDFLSRFTSFDDRLFGKLNLNANFSGKGNRVEDIQKTLVANGTATFENGKLINWELLDRLATLLKIKSFKEQDIKTLRNSFRIQERRVWFDDFSATTKDGDFELIGSVGLDGSLDYMLTAVLSPELSLRFDALGDLSDYLKNEEGRVVLDIKISGPAKNPEFALDTSKAEKKFKDQMKAKVEEEKDELKDQLKEKAEDLLKDLFKKKKK
ncbi:MAG: AsmA family protein [candidate division Zixibacteria bacterium]|nr:AsmA family protein [candidate division Zixibacteria bacterium]